MFGRRVWQRFVMKPLVVLAIACLAMLHRLALWLDDWLHSGYRDVEVQRPLFVVGPPRSGTTLAHRTAAGESERFTAMPLWELILAPAVWQKRMLRRLKRMDRRLGGWGLRVVRWLDARLLGAFDEVHPSSLFLAEEDSLGLVVFGTSFHQVLAFPASDRVWRLARLDHELTEQQRQRVVRQYRGLLQRHLYFRGKQKTLVSKNPCFTGWLQTLAEEFPDAAFLAPLRTPQEGLPSQLSSIEDAVEFFGADIRDPMLVDRFAEMYRAYFEHLASFADSLAGTRLAVLSFPTLRDNASAEVRAALHGLGYCLLPANPDACETSAPPRSPFRSKHRYSLQDYGLESSEVEQRLGAPFRAALALYRGPFDRSSYDLRKRGEHHVIRDF